MVEPCHIEVFLMFLSLIYLNEGVKTLETDRTAVLDYIRLHRCT